MTEDRRPRVDKVSGEFFKSGLCSGCGKSAERTKTVSASTYEEMLRLGEEWSAEPVVHKRCE